VRGCTNICVLTLNGNYMFTILEIFVCIIIYCMFVLSPHIESTDSMVLTKTISVGEEDHF